MKRTIGISLIVFILSMSMVLAGTVTRSFSPATATPGGSVSVTLTVAAVGTATFYLMDEIYPAGWAVTAPGGGSTTDPGHLKWAVTSGAADTSYTYTLTVPASATFPASFSGVYRFEGDAASAPIGGSTQLSTSNIICGDGYRDYPEEACDDGNIILETSCPYGTAVCTLCNADCSAELNLQGSYCGEGTVDSANGEVCDTTELNGRYCITEGFDGGNLACASDCRSFDTSSCTRTSPPGGTCGDGTVDPGEACDGTDLGGASCESQGFKTGTLSCAASCTFDTSACLTERAWFVEEMGRIYDAAKTAGGWSVTLVTDLSWLLRSIFS